MVMDDKMYTVINGVDTASLMGLARGGWCCAGPHEEFMAFSPAFGDK